MSSTAPNVPSRSSSISATRRGRSSSTRRETTKRDSWSQDLERQAEFLKKHISSISTDIEPIRPRSRSSPAPKMSRDPSAAPSRNSPRSTKAQRWAGLTRSVSTWDDLRKDPELWSPDGDCHVHLYARGASRRGPSFRVPLRALRQKNCSPMLTVCYAQSVSGASTERLVSFTNLNRGPNHVELYIPAPEDASKEDAFDWHITTRNFFAYVLGKPLVGHHMGEAFVNLQERMKLFRAVDADHHQDFLQYIEQQGYRDVVECTDYALASLYYAERYKLRAVWIDAFTHCVGMNDSLALSPEFSRISRLTKALITRASLEVDIHLDNVAKAMRTFLEEDFSPVYIGLTDGARSHMDRFRRFLHHFYTKKFGYWPPPRSTTTFPKAVYQSMFYDFTNLYDYLVDTSSTTDISSQKPASGGICVLQNLDQFDKRHKFVSQPHPLPLLPELEQLSTSSGSQRLSRTLSAASQSRKRDSKLKKSAALAAAANVIHPNVVNSKIVQAYMDFEKSYATSSSQRDEKLSTADGRKVRWLVIYGTLQYLSSVLQAPKHVRDTESPEYPLCSLVSPHSAWSVATPLTTPPPNDVGQRHRATDDYFGHHTGSSMASSEIQPDCRREDYFGSQQASPSEAVDIPAPLKLRGCSRQNSLRSFAPLQSLSALSSRRNSLKLGSTDDISRYRSSTTASSSIQHTRESSPAPPPRKLESTSEEVDWLERRAPPTPPESPPVPAIRGHNRKRTPLLHSFQLDEQNYPASPVLLNDAMSRSDSTSSNTSSVWSDEGSAASSKSSMAGGFLYKGNAAEYSGLLSGLGSLNGSPTHITFPDFHEDNVHPLLRRSPAPREDFEFGFDQETTEPSSSSETVGQVGMAVSDEAVPPPIELQKSAYPRAMQQYIELERPSTSSTVKPGKGLSRKQSRSTDILSVKRPSLLSTRYSEMPVGQSKNSNPPTVTKTTHAGATSAPIKTPSLMVRILSDDRKQKLKDRRLSSFFRR